jgi:hypothetical protein
MSDALNAVLERAMSDAAFRAQLAADPAAALVGYDLTAEERAAFAAGTAKAERLEERMSKTDLSAALNPKTSSPRLHSPSETRRSG